MGINYNAKIQPHGRQNNFIRSFDIRTCLQSSRVDLKHITTWGIESLFFCWAYFTSNTIYNNITNWQMMSSHYSIF